jgi:hypothetical protein
VPAQRAAAEDDRRVGHQREPEGHAGGAGPVGDEREVERRTVPGGEDAGRQVPEAGVEGGEQVRLVAVEDLVARRGRERRQDHRRDGRIEPVDRGVGLDVEAVDGRRPVVPGHGGRLARMHRAQPVS